MRNAGRSRWLFDSLPFYALLIDDRRKVLYANRLVRQDYGRVPTGLMKLVNPGVTRGSGNADPASAKSTPGDRAVMHEFFDSSRRRWLSAAIQPARHMTVKGRPAFLLIARDITEQKLTAEALRKGEERYRSLVRNFDGIVYERGVDFTAYYLHGAVEELTGYREPDFIAGRPRWDQIIHPDDLDRLAEDFALVREVPDYRTTWKYRIVRSDGRTCWVSDTLHNVLDGARVPRCVRGMIRDVTEHRQAERLMSESELRLKTTVELAPDGILTTDMNGVVTSCNPAFLRMTGYDPSELVGRHFWRLPVVRESDAGVYSSLFSSVASGIGPEQHELIWVHHNGAERVGEVHAALMRELANPTGVLAIVRDITERKQTEEELANYRRHLEELVDARTEELRKAQEELVRKERLAALGRIAGGVAHEIRSPLGVMRNAAYFLNLMVGDKLVGKPARHLQIIDNEIEKTNAIITSLLDFAQGRPTTRTPCRISDILAEAIQRAELAPGVTLELALPRDLPQVNVDHHQVVQVFSNLLTNAAQAMSKRGRIRVAAQVIGDELSVTVADTGPGIKPEHKDRIFEPLFSTKAVGVGLGLPLARSYVEANLGTIRVESEPGQGATFTVALPVSHETARDSVPVKV